LIADKFNTGVQSLNIDAISGIVLTSHDNFLVVVTDYDLMRMVQF
jgi:hypothetical protein